ncbi:hypothetical protein D3C84_1261050 [compost metagenome]
MVGEVNFPSTSSSTSLAAIWRICALRLKRRMMSLTLSLKPSRYSSTLLRRICWLLVAVFCSWLRVQVLVL